VKFFCVNADFLRNRLGKYRVVVQNYSYHETNRDERMIAVPCSGHMCQVPYVIGAICPMCHMPRPGAKGQPHEVAIPFRVLVRKNGEVTEFRGETPAGKTGDASNVEIVEFEYKGRTMPLPDTTHGPCALTSSNLVAVTASVGSTLDALSNLIGLGQELADIDLTRALVNEEADLDAPQPSSSDAMQLEGDGNDHAEERVGAQVLVTSQQAEMAAGRQPMLASRGRFEVTSRDRLHLQLAKLPRRFHDMVAAAFGGPTLLELTASHLASRLLETNTPASVLRAQGYPEHIIDMVKRLMATRGASAK